MRIRPPPAPEPWRRFRAGLLPPVVPGMRIGLYGGSFNPPHAGHLHVSRIALRRLRLDRIWWLVSPGNPLKSHDALAALAARTDAARALADDPRIVVTGFEGGFPTRYTVETLRRLHRRCRGVSFVWIMGADSLAGFHRWKGFSEIARLMPLAIVDRPGFTHAAVRARGARALEASRIDEAAAPALTGRVPPAWIFLHGPRSSLSSTQLRDHAAGRG